MGKPRTYPADCFGWRARQSILEPSGPLACSSFEDLLDQNISVYIKFNFDRLTPRNIKYDSF
jgi:hypothetical protein